MACRFPFIKIEEKIPGTFLRENVYIPYTLFRALTARLYFCHFALLTKLLATKSCYQGKIQNITMVHYEQNWMQKRPILVPYFSEFLLKITKMK